jgi:hypothetical protein
MVLAERGSAGASLSTRAWVALVFAVAALLQLGLTLVAAHAQWHEMPRWDDLSFLWSDLKQPGELDLVELFRQNNEHRLVIPRLILRADLEWFAATGMLVRWPLVALQLLHVVVIIAIFRRCQNPSRPAQVIVGAVATLLLFSCHQLENFIWRVQLSSVLVYLAASAAFWCLLAAHGSWRRGRRRSAALLLAATACTGFVTNYSRADGNLVWPLLILLAWRLQLPRAHVWVLAICGALSVGAYFHGYATPPQQGSPLTALGPGLRRAVAFVCVFVGAQVPHFGVPVAGLLGAAGVLGAVVLVIRACRNQSNPGRLGLSAIVLFTGATAVVTALGRSAGPLEGALVFRYATPALLFWVALLALLVDDLTRNVPRNPMARNALWVAITIFVAAGLAQQPLSIAHHAPIRRGLERATMAVFSRVCDTAALFHLTTPSSHLAEILEHMRARRVAVFRHGLHEWLGDALANHVVTENGAGTLAGAISRVEAIPGPACGVAVHGWISRCPRTPAPAHIVLTDRDTVVGFGSCAIEPPRVDGTVPWFGYARTLDRDKPVLTAYALTEHGRRASALAGLLPAPALDDVRNDSLGWTIASVLVGVSPPSFHRDYLAAVAPFAGVIGRQLPAATLAAAREVPGEVEFVEPMSGADGAVRMRGWVAASAHATPGTVLVLGEQAQVLGGGTVGRATATALARLPWAAWAIAETASPIATICFPDNRGGSRMRIAPAFPTDMLALPAALGGIVAANTTLHGSWTSASELKWFLPPPDQGPVADSWAGSDHHHGRCTLGPIERDGKRSLGVLVLVGPDARGQTVCVRDVATGHVVQQLDTHAVRGVWRIWRVDLSRATGAVLVEAEDRGSGWGQWLALGRLHWLR